MRHHHPLLAASAILLGVSYYLGYTPLVLSATFAVSSTVAYWLYAKDKAAAKSGAWRVPENNLHIVALLFGWPGALFAQKRLRHKTKKQSFRARFWFTVVVNISVVGWLHGPQGNSLLRQSVYQLENIVISNVPHNGSVSTVLLLTRFRDKVALWSR